jgi:hypothetical protein
MSKSANTKNYQPNFSLFSWLVRLLLYSSVFASVFLPSYVAIEFPFSGCRNKHWVGGSMCHPPRGVEGRNNIDAINRAQLSYHLENNKFAGSIAQSGIGIQVENPNTNYRYRIVQPMIPRQDLEESVINNSELPITMAIAQTKHDNLRNTFGAAYYGSEVIFQIVCQMTEEDPLPRTMPTVVNGKLECPGGIRKLGK